MREDAAGNFLAVFAVAVARDQFLWWGLNGDGNITAKAVTC